MKIFQKLYKWGDKYFLNFFEKIFREKSKKVPRTLYEGEKKKIANSL